MKLVYLENLEKFAEKIAEKVRELFVLKEDGKGLSSNDFTAEDKAKVANIPTDYIKSGLQTEASTADSGVNTYTFTTSSGGASAFKVRNGSKGSAGATGAAGQRGSRWSHGTAVTGSSTTGAVFSGTGITDALVNDCYLNTSTGNVYRCTASGNASTAKWAYTGSIKGATGAAGSAGAKGATGATGAAGQRGSRWSHGTAVTGSSTTGAVFSGTGITDALVNDCYLNTSTGNVYRCTASGNASTAKWAYTGSIKGATGEMGNVDEITEADIGKIVNGTFSG